MNNIIENAKNLASDPQERLNTFEKSMKEVHRNYDDSFCALVKEALSHTYMVGDKAFASTRHIAFTDGGTAYAYKLSEKKEGMNVEKISHEGDPELQCIIPHLTFNDFDGID